MKLKHSAGMAAGIAATTALLIIAAAWANPRAHGVEAHLIAMRDAIMPMQTKLNAKASVEGFRAATHAVH